MLILALIGDCRPVVGDPVVEPAAVRPIDPAVIFVVRRGWHIDVGLSASDLAPPLRTLSDQFPGVRYLVFGFGDRRYLLDNDQAVLGKLAALWPGSGLMLVTGLTAPPETAFGANDVIRLVVSPAQARKFGDFLWESLARQGATAAPVAAGPYQGSLYFGATESYSAIHTCNTWAAEALGAADLPIRSSGVLIAEQLWGEATRLANARSASLNRARAPADP
jgi:hypothetical protein